VEDFSFDTIKTKNMAAVLNSLKLTGTKTLVMMAQQDEKVYLSGRNIPKVDLEVFDRVSTYDILNHKKIVLFKSALENINNSYNK
jgi:large subunit ribosomal protein L4